MGDVTVDFEDVDLGTTADGTANSTYDIAMFDWNLDLDPEELPDPYYVYDADGIATFRCDSIAAEWTSD